MVSTQPHGHSAFSDSQRYCWPRSGYVPTAAENRCEQPPLGRAVNAAVFLALYLTPFYAPALSVTSDAALIFYCASMLLAATSGYAGGEVLAVSNWLLHRDDCVLFFPIDHVEQRHSTRTPLRHG